MLSLLTFGILSASVLAADPMAVTCGSTLKLTHKEANKQLHSHQIGWGSGSGQQSVTTQNLLNDQNDLWTIQHATTEPFCPAGTSIRCGDKVRLTHIGTGKNLHSHLFKSALSGFQEVSCFGDNGSGDTGDNWIVECDSKRDKFWMRDAPVHFKHTDTGKYLYTSNAVTFTQQNCGQQCPIMGQTEVSCANKREGQRTAWVGTQGVFFPPKDYHHGDGDEL